MKNKRTDRGFFSLSVFMEVNMKITKKTLDIKYRKTLGSELTNRIDLYNDFTCSDIHDSEDIVFMVFSNEDRLCIDKLYQITGIGSKKSIDWESRVEIKHLFKYLYKVSLIPTEYYQQVKGAFNFKGKCIEEKRYKLNFQHKDIAEKQNTIFNFIDEQTMPDDYVGLSLFAIKNYNYKLLENIYREKELNIFEQVNETFKDKLIQKIDKSNHNKTSLQKEIEQLSTVKDFVNYMKDKKNDILRKEPLYTKNDNPTYTYPINLILCNTYIDFFVKNEFNSAAPFYYQYRNYKIATKILLDSFMNDFEPKTQKEILTILQEIYQNENFNESHIKVDKSNFGLYFPLFMNFRHSIELSFKLIYINECVKKQLKSLKECSKDLKNHNLLLLLDLVRPYLEEYISSEELDFYNSLCSFITYFEHKDASFSRYIINNELDFEALEKINMYCKDLTNYILEFYEMMDETLSKIDFGFEFDNIFTQ